MPQSEMPTMRSRRLGGELRRLREAAGLTMVDAARELQCGQPKISRIESGMRGIRPLDLDHLLSLYGVKDQTMRGALKRLASEVHKRDWWTSQGPLLHDDLKDYLTLETDSELIRTYEQQLFPGILQTPEYMREIFRQHRSDEEVRVMTETRLKRQRILADTDTVRLRVVLDVTVLHRLVGSPDIMTGQIEHTLKVAKQPNVAVQVLPLDAAMKPDQYTPYTLLTMRGAPPADYAWLEHLTGGTLLERETDVRRYQQAWDDHTATALPPRDSLTYLRDSLEKYTS